MLLFEQEGLQEQDQDENHQQGHFDPVVTPIVGNRLGQAGAVDLLQDQIDQQDPLHAVKQPMR